MRLLTKTCQTTIRTWRHDFPHFLLTYLWRYSAAPARQ